MKAIMSMNPFCTVTDATALCMQQPGAVATAFVELETGRPIAGDGANNVDIDEVTSLFTPFLLSYCATEDDSASVKSRAAIHSDTVQTVVITTGNHVHLLHPMTHSGKGLYLYLALDRSRGNIPLSRRCLVDIDHKLYL